MAYFSLVQFLNTLDNPVKGHGQNDSVFLSGFVMYRISISDFAIAMVFLGGFIDNEIRLRQSLWQWWWQLEMGIAEVVAR